MEGSCGEKMSCEEVSCGGKSCGEKMSFEVVETR